MSTYRSHPYWTLTITSLSVIAVFLSVLGTPTGRVSAQSGTGVIRVTTTGSDVNGCGSETATCRTLQFAANQASPGDTIFVAEGIYNYNSTVMPSIPCYDYGVTATVLCVNGKNLQFLGGYSSDWLVSDPVHHPTVIDGQNTYRGVSLQNGTFSLDGFTIQNGLAQGATSGSDFVMYAYGGGMVVTLASVTLRNMVFNNNQAIGGNTAQVYGGGGTGGALSINNYDSSNPINATLEHITFENNLALGGEGNSLGGTAIGGAFFSYAVSVSGNDLTFTDNQAVAGATNGGGFIANRAYADAQGGAAAIYQSPNTTLQSVMASGNQALGGNAPNGDAGGAFGGALYMEHVQQVTLTDGYFTANLAEGGSGKNSTSGAGIAEGGAMQSDDTSVTLERISIIANTTRGGSGASTGYRGSVGGGGAAFTGIGWSGRIINMNNCIVADNQLQFGALGQKTGGGGGGLWLQSLTANISQSTIARNTVNDSWLSGPALIVIGPYGSAPTTNATIAYTIVSDHSGGEGAVYVQSGATITFNRGLWSNNSPDTNVNGYQPGTINGLSTMLHGTPNYVSPGSPNYNYDIQGNSAARDQALGSTDVTDIASESRLLFPPADIGAYEYIPIVLTVVPIADGKLQLIWQVDPTLAINTHSYAVSFTRENGANNPREGGSPINVGMATSFVLSGLTDFKQYTFTVQALNTSNATLDHSNTIMAVPVNHFVFMPSVMR